MKKYISLLFVFAFILNFNLAGAITNSATESTNVKYEKSEKEKGCIPGGTYNVLTGEKCSVVTTTDCPAGHLFSATTGKPCEKNGTNPTKPMPKCDRWFKTELKMGSKGEDVKVLQQALKDDGLMTGKVDGIYGKITESARQNYHKKCPIKNSGEVKNKVGELFIKPNPITLEVDGSTSVVAYYQAPMPECAKDMYCAQVMPDKKEVAVSWSISDSSVAKLMHTSGETYASVSALKEGYAKLTATYTVGGKTVTAVSKVEVEN